MSLRKIRAGLVLSLAAMFVLAAAGLRAGVVGGRQQAVGGVSVDANGVVNNIAMDELGKLSKLREQALTPISEDMDESTALRKVSLKRLQEVIKKHVDKNEAIPDDVQFLAGLQRIKYVFVYPEEKDIVLVGPAEGWKIDAQGNVVGKKTGNPVLQLDDLLVALRSAVSATQSNITCSIDPKPEGMARLQSFVKDQGGKIGADPAATVKSLEEVLAAQSITFGGISGTTHFARVLVAADYRMKRLGMGFEKSPVPGMASFLDMSTGVGNMFPRWWLTSNYQPMLTSAQGDAWELRGPGVKAMTEDSFFAANGTRTTTKNVNPVAQKWADNMTGKYEELAAKVPVFNELRNMMDLAVLGALIRKENLAQKAGLDLSELLNPVLATAELHVPKEVPSQASFVKKGRNFVISVSGGVEINPYDVVAKRETNETLDPIRKSAAPAATVWQWWWN